MAALRALLAALLLAASFWTLTVTPAEACSCVGWTPEEQVARADLIVIGTTTDQRLSDPTPTPPSSSEPYVLLHDGIETELTVEEYMKGTGPAELVLVSRGALQYDLDGEVQITPGSDPSCGFVPEVDARYLFFLRSSDDSRHRIGSYGGQFRIAAGDEAALARVEEIRQLAQQPQPTPAVDGLPDTGSAGTGAHDYVFLSVIAVAGAGAALFATGIFAIRRTDANGEN